MRSFLPTDLVLNPAPLRSGLLAFALSLGAMLPLWAQDPAEARTPETECVQGRISDVFIDNHSIFDPVSIPEEGRLRWAYRAANAVHMRTRESFIRREVLFREGDCYNPLLLQESARILRRYRFIAAADVFSVPQPDGSRHVVIDTRDEWTTKITIGVRVEDGFRFDGASLVEENFLGRGNLVGIYHRQRNEQRATGAVVELPRVGRTGWGLELSGSRTRVGNSARQLLEHPFTGEVGTHAFRQRVSTTRDLYTWVLADDDSFSHLVLPIEEGGGELTAARRFGFPGHLLMLGAGLSTEWIRTDPLEVSQGIVDRDFGSRLEVPIDLLSPLATQVTDRRTTRANLMAGIRRIDYTERRGLDALRGLQDVATGREVVVTVGQSLAGPGDLFGRVDLFGGFASGQTVGQVHSSVEGRALQGAEGGTRDVLAELHAFLYRPIDLGLPQTLVLRAAMQGGWRVEGPFQLTLGGPDGLRGHREDAWPGGRRFLVSIEDRVLLPGPFPELMDLGLTFFGDVGRMYAADVPFGADSGWQGSVGGGLRIGFPAGSSAVIRADVAIPVGRDAPSGPVLRIHAREWIGILGEFRSGQMERVRRSGVQSEFQGVGREGRR